MFGIPGRLDILDIFTIILIAVATALSFTSGFIVQLIPFVSTVSFIAGAAVVAASIAALLQAISINNLAEEIDPDTREELDQVPRSIHQDLVDRAYTEGFNRGRYQGYRKGIQEGSDLALQTSTDAPVNRVIDPKHGEQQSSSTNTREEDSAAKTPEGVSQDYDDEEFEGAESDDEGQEESKSPEVEERIKELEEELE